MLSKLYKLNLWIPNASIFIICVIQWCFIPSGHTLLMFDKIALFYWLLHRPDRISLVWLSLFYVVGDIIEGWPLGFSALLLLLCAWFILLQRHVILKQTFLFQWLFLSLVIMTNLLGFSSLYVFSDTAVLPFVSIGVSGCFAVLSYPLMTFVLHRLQRLVPIYVPARV